MARFSGMMSARERSVHARADHGCEIPEPIADVPPAEFELAYHRQCETQAMAA